MRTWLDRLMKRRPGKPRRPGLAPRCSLGVEELEQRLVPAFNLTISTAPTVGVEGPLFDLLAAAPGANINVADIRTGLRMNRGVTINTGLPGTEAGNITWLPGSDLDYAGLFATSLTIVTATTGDVSLGSRIFDSTAPSGESLSLNVVARGNVQVNGDVLAGGGRVSLAADLNRDGSPVGPAVTWPSRAATWSSTPAPTPPR
jgi:hypothetical protein